MSWLRTKPRFQLGPEPATTGAMADSGFWRGLAQEFGALQTTLGMLRADFAYTLGSSPGEWKLKGAGQTSTVQFEILAIRGASALPGAGASALHAWLEALRLARGYSDFALAGIEQYTDGTEGAHRYTDTIPRVCEASADYCRGRESTALEADYQKNQQNNSRLAPGVATTVHEPDRVRMVDDFILQCNLGSQNGLKVMRKHIPLALGHAKPRQFQYWQRNSDKATPEDDRNIRRILSMRPADFVTLLREKGILRPGS